MVKRDFTRLTPDEKINGIKATKLPDHIRSKYHGEDVREAIAQSTEMAIQLGINMGLSPDDAVSWARKLQEAVPRSEFDSWVATLLDGGPSIFMNTLSELTTTYPNGASGIALVRETDPAKIYVWNGTAWEDFGDYQGIELKDNSVTWNKVQGIAMSLGNLYTGNNFILNKYSDVTGEIKPATGWGVEIVDVPLVSRTYSIMLPDGNYSGDIGSIAFLDDNLNSLGKAYAQKPKGYYNGIPYITVTLPTGATKIGITALSPSKFDHRGKITVVNGNEITNNSLKSSIRQIFGAEIQDTYARSQIYQGFAPRDNSVTTEKVVDEAITPNKISKNGNRINHFNKDDVMTGRFYTGSTVGIKAYIAESTSYSGMATPIPVRAGDVVHFNYARFNSYYLGVDDNDTIVQIPPHVGTGPITTSVTVADGVTKFHTTSSDANLANAMITINQPLPESYVNYDTFSKTTLDWLKLSPSNLPKPYKGKKWVVFGDSLTEANSRTTKNYHGYVADDLGFSVTNMGVSGTGYKRRDDVSNAFYQRISNVPLDTDVITIFGSFNDLGASVPLGTASDTGTDTLGGAINTTLDKLNSRLPVVPVGIISPTPWETSEPWNDSNKATQYVKLLKDICKNRGLPLLDLYYSSGLRPWDAEYRLLMYSRDGGSGTHPDEKGHKFFYPQVREFIKTLI